MRILIVEDESSITQLICQHYCQPRNHECVVARSLKEAISVVGDFDLVLCDLNLPDSDGWPTLLEIRARFPEKTRVIVMSGGLREEDIPKAIEYGASDVLFKPWTAPAEFARRIDMALELSRHPVIDRGQKKLDDIKKTVEDIKAVNQSISNLKEPYEKKRPMLLIF